MLAGRQLQNFDRFIRDGLGIDDTERNLLREKYLEAGNTRQMECLLWSKRG